MSWVWKSFERAWRDMPLASRSPYCRGGGHEYKWSEAQIHSANRGEHQKHLNRLSQGTGSPCHTLPSSTTFFFSENKWKGLKCSTRPQRHMNDLTGSQPYLGIAQHSSTVLYLFSFPSKVRGCLYKQSLISKTKTKQNKTFHWVSFVFTFLYCANMSERTL